MNHRDAEVAEVCPPSRKDVLVAHLLPMFGGAAAFFVGIGERRQAGMGAEDRVAQVVAST